MTALEFTFLKVSFGSSYAYFNNLLEFPYLFRTVPSTEMFNIAKIELLEKYKWHRVGMVFDRDDPPLSLVNYNCFLLTIVILLKKLYDKNVLECNLRVNYKPCSLFVSHKDRQILYSKPSHPTLLYGGCTIATTYW